METPLTIFAELASGAPGVLCTVIQVQGSSPGKAGFKILVREDGTTLGTVGGGILEQRVIEKATQVLSDRMPATEVYDLTEKKTGMWCGGRVTVFFDPVRAPDRLLLFGLGHVGRAVRSLAPIAGFRPFVVDDGSEADHQIDWPSLDPFPVIGQWDSVLLLTLDPALELEAVVRLASSPPRYIGVLGSSAKAKKMRGLLAGRGIAPDSIPLHLPVGLSIGAQTPGEIAVSIVSEMIRVRHGT